MKNIFSFNRQTKPRSAETPVPEPPPLPRANPVVHTTGLQPKYTVPPVPHPRPYDHIAILATTDAILLRPRINGIEHPQTHVHIAYGKDGKVEERQGDGEGHGTDWSAAVIVYGIVGILELFTTSYLLVITSKADVGCVLDPRYTIYAAKNVAAIPLTQDGAGKLLVGLRARNSATARMSLIPTSPSDAQSTYADISQTVTPTSASEPRVKFADETQVKIMTPGVPDQSFVVPEIPEADHAMSPTSVSSSLSSGASTPTSEMSGSTTQLAKTLSERLSFWNRLPAPRTSMLPSPVEVLNEADQTETPLLGLECALEPVEVIENAEKDELSDALATPAPAPASEEDKHRELEEKILRQTVKDFAKGEMYFAYDFDITRSLQHKQDLICKSKRQSRLIEELTSPGGEKALSATVGDEVDVLAEPSPTLPLWRRVDRQFWWNENLSRSFIDAGLHDYVLPIIQGYFQISSFPVPREPEANESGDAAIVDYIIMSRRSRDRAGLRYQRRGVDDDAHVANFVETETITRIEREGIANVFSYVQIRGSIPLFWTQSGYSLKPSPQLSPSQTHIQNLGALKRHFDRTVFAYGHNTIVNLAEQHGKEGQVTNAYREYAEEAKLPDVKYCEYDFHVETKGMRYENIQKLIVSLERTFEAQGYFWVSDGHILCRQNGVYRVNCIDCLDRTNVVQSAFARYVLNRQLLALALFRSNEAHAETDVVFNDVWANNGDAISRAYAGTSALKGDFTRTGKRDISGMLNDGMNSLARMYASTFSDWFCQAVIDYMLGYRTLTVFSEFLDKLQSTDPRELIRLSKIRAEAIATSVSRLLQEGEGLLSGWTLLSPAEMNVKVADKWEEKVMLLSRKALYIISYDYSLEKVKVYTRIPLGDIVEITKGPYILSPLQEASRDPEQNFGFTVRWLALRAETRMTSYSIRNSPDVPPPQLSPTVRMSIGTTTPPLPPLNPNAPITSKEPAATSSSVKQAPQANAPAPATAKAAAIVRSASRRAFGATPRLSTLLQAQGQPVDTPTAFAAFKCLPVDPARARRGEAADEYAGAQNCREATAYMVETIRGACADIGGAHGADGREDNFVVEADIVGLAEAQKMTSVYAKMEYGLKRLLWLGG